MDFDRPDWDDYYLAMAETASLRADCRRRKVGAIVVKDGGIIGSGYNGTDSGRPGCLAGACPRGLLSYEQQPAFGSYSNCIARHAERNALWRAEQNVGWRYLYDSVVYVNQEPCQDCQDLCSKKGVVQIVTPTSVYDLVS